MFKFLCFIFPFKIWKFNDLFPFFKLLFKISGDTYFYLHTYTYTNMEKEKKKREGGRYIWVTDCY